MLKKTALSLFGLVAMLICLNPPQANAGVVVAIGPAFPRPVYVRPYRYVAPVPYVAYRPDPYFYAPAYPPVYVRPGWGYRPGVYVNPHFAPRRIEHREFVARRPYWRR
ncbi:MAG: hypothetical protein ACRD23_11460 [Terriglobales bacterium]